MGNKPKISGNLKLQLKINLKQILELVAQLPDKEKLELCKALKEELEEKGLVRWLELGNAKTSVDFRKLMDWEKDLPEEDEKEMTEEEWQQAIEEMS